MAENHFKGTIPASFEQLKGIQVLDLSRNNLSGKIPMFFEDFTSIRTLNLSYNMFEGEVPNEGLFRNISAFSVVGNNKLCGGVKGLQLPSCDKKNKKAFNYRIIIPLVATLFIVLLLFFLLAIIFLIRRSRKKNSSVSLVVQDQYMKLSYAEILQATDGFSSDNLIGKGSYGSVFKGILNYGEKIVAVKVLNLHEPGANKSFVVECEALKNIRHRNLVKIITSCSSIDFKGNEFKALVFEFMPNGSLESWLHPSLSGSKNLNIVQRLNIAIDVASALDYLHHDCEAPFIHCDIKPSNILIDDYFCGRIGDFGFTTALSNHQNSSSIGIRGTIGYVPPEYGMGKDVSTQGDMYSYGVLLLEMFTGKRPTHDMFRDNFSLCTYVKMSLPDQVMKIVDPRIVLEEEEEPSRIKQKKTTNNISELEICLAAVLHVGVLCSAEIPSERMNARDVLMELHKIRNIFFGDGGERS